MFGVLLITPVSLEHFDENDLRVLEIFITHNHKNVFNVPDNTAIVKDRDNIFFLFSGI